jgi:hypothetical protein
MTSVAQAAFITFLVTPSVAPYTHGVEEVGLIYDGIWDEMAMVDLHSMVVWLDAIYPVLCTHATWFASAIFYWLF